MCDGLAREQSNDTDIIPTFMFVQRPLDSHSGSSMPQTPNDPLKHEMNKQLRKIASHSFSKCNNNSKLQVRVKIILDPCVQQST